MGGNIGGPWRRLRQKIDIGKWLEAPAPGVLFETPRILCVEGFAPASICDSLIALGRPRLRAAEVYDPLTGQARTHATRTNSVVSFNIAQYDVILVTMQARIAALAGVGVEALEPPMILHYEPGQQFAPHYDYLDPATMARDIATFGQRVGTCLLYLNDDYEGGETAFPLLDFRYKGRKGDALLFWSADAAGALDRNTQHAGLPPDSGEKWLLSQWIRRRIR